jgi:hypothetical protein
MGQDILLVMLREFFQPDVDTEGKFELAKGNKNIDLFKRLIISNMKTYVHKLDIVDNY